MDEFTSIYDEYLKGSKLGKNHTAIYYQGNKISFKKLNKLINKYSAILQNKLNIKKDDVVIIALPNIPDCIILFLALNRIGAVCNMIHPYTPFNQFKEIMNNTKAKYAFVFEQRVAKEVDKYKDIVDKVYVSRVEDYLPLFKKIFYHCFMNFRIRNKLGKQWRFKGFSYVYKLNIFRKKVLEIKKKRDELSVLLHSGSTTGDPKTICLSNYNFNFLSKHALEYLCVDQKEVIGKGMLSALPSFHGFGLEWTMLAPLCNGFGSLLVTKFSAESVVDVLKHNKVIAMCGVPTMFETLLKNEKFKTCSQLKYLQVAFCGGDSLPSSVENDFNDVLKNNNSTGRIFEGYGLTESIAAFVVNTKAHYCKGSLGYPGSGVEMGIFDENKNLINTPNVLGEIGVKSPSNMIGYFKDEKASEACMKDGYILSGDLGYINEDGFLFFKQRIKRVIKVSGVGVFPSEVEKLVCSISGVDNACAIRIPDKKLQSALKLFVVTKAFDKEDMRQKIMDTCRKYLIRWSVPKEIEFRDNLPLTMIGKVDFKTLQKEEDEKRKEDN